MKPSACRAFPINSIRLAPYLSTAPPSRTPTGSDSSDAIEIAAPTWTSVRSVVNRK